MIFTRAVLVSLIPVVFYLGSSIYWFLKSGHQKDWWQMLILNFIIVSFFLQATVIKELAIIFQCKIIDDQKYVLTSLDTSCEDDYYMRWRNIFYLPILSFWIFIFPFLCLQKLIASRKNLENPQIKLYFGFFYFGYKPEYFYWEFVIMYRRILMMAITLFSEKYIFLKGCFSLFLNLLACFFQRKKSPFKDIGLNYLELKANFASTVTVFIGLFYLSDVSDGWKTICFALIVILNIYFIMNWAKFVFYVSFKEISHTPLIKKLCPRLPKKILLMIKSCFNINNGLNCYYSC